jgi:hypothetical protein
VLFATAARAAGVYTSAAINVQAFRTARFFLDVTVPAATSLAVDVQTQDPQTGKWATAQSNIFGAAANAVLTSYADIGEVGCDDFIRVVVTTVGAGNSNWSVSMVTKEAYGSTLSPPAIFLGNANVVAGFGYPLLGGTKEKWLLMDNTPLFGVALAATPIRVFQLQ